MKRKLLTDLTIWKDHPLRKPLILRGARQVGKSHLVKMFGQQFEHFIEINFEKDRKAAQLFDDSLSPSQLIPKIAAYTEKQIVMGKTLLFLDEIQECEQAILALRYFKEEMPDLHIIAAGSLLDFKLQHCGLPVGRVQFMYLHPLSFEEYCHAIGRSTLYEQAQQQIKLTAPLHDLLLQEVKNFCWLGGMPAVVDAWCKHQNYEMCEALQDEILLAYRYDFNKYAKNHQILHVEKIFSHIGYQLGQKFKYATVEPALKAASLREALELLEMAGIIYRVFHSSAQGLPLAVGVDIKRFKAYFFDIGLLQRLLGVNKNTWLFQPLSVTHLGGLAEQFVLQEYIAYSTITTPAPLFYWHREANQSNAEVDFLWLKNNEIVPVEVKSGSAGKLKSMHLFLDSHPHSAYGLKISEASEPDFQQINSIPFYAIHGWLNEK